MRLPRTGPAQEALWTALRGFLMGSADVVPGVSGGTVALVLGIYRRLIDAIRTGSSALASVARLDVRRGIAHLREVEWLFIVPLLTGIGAAIVLLADLVETQLDEHPVELAGLFVGLVAGAVVVAWGLIRRRDPRRAAVAIVVAALLFALLGLRGGVSEEEVSQRDSVAVWAFFLAGAVAICAMILPGISGSLLLVLLGMYEPVLDAVTERDAASIAAFLAGATLGLALFSQLLHWALEHHHDTLMAALVGLMAGSVRVLWPWPDGLNGTSLGAPSGAVAVPLALAALGAAAVVLVGRRATQIQISRESARAGGQLDGRTSPRAP